MYDWGWSLGLHWGMCMGMSMVHGYGLAFWDCYAMSMRDDSWHMGVLG